MLLSGFKDEGVDSEVALAKLTEQWPVTYIEPQCSFKASPPLEYHWITL